jgi:organic radical activating enzyme
MTKRIPKPISGGIILSYQCSAECQHCIYACSPKWNADWISQEDLEKILTQLTGKILSNTYGPNTTGLNYGLHFTGGEPFLNFELLCKAVEISTKLKIPSSFVETNCFWCVDDKTTKEKLKLLKKKGLKGILISVNPFYLEYVPFERTERAIRISLEVFGRNVMVYQLEYYRRFKEWGVKDRVSFEDYLNLEKKEYFARNVEFFIMGRAAYKLKNVLEEFYPRYQSDCFFNKPCVTPFLRSWHNHFDNYGNYIPGFCGGISLGDCMELDKLLNEGIDTEQYPVLTFLINEDFKGLCRFAKDLGYIESPDGYFSKCHLCMDIRKYLILKQDFKELSPKEFYLHLE